MLSLLVLYEVILGILGIGAIIALSVAVIQIFVSKEGPGKWIIFEATLIAILCFAVLAFLEILEK